MNGRSHDLGVGLVVGEGHEFGLGGVSLEAVVVEPGEDGLVFGLG